MNQTALPLVSHSRALRTAMVALLTLALSPAARADVPPGKLKSRPCSTCHGPSGLAVMPGAPNLAGQPAMYLEEQLKNFRSGVRQNEIMNLMAKPLSDQDIGDLAAWFESIRVVLQSSE
jgi:cytochrome c553